MGNKIYFSQIQAKIDRLQRERTQVLEHLKLVERKIKKLNDALEVMEDEASTDEYDTEVYSYRTYKHRFRGKLRPMVLVVLKAQPDHYFTVNEITEIVLIKDRQDPIVRPIAYGFGAWCVKTLADKRRSRTVRKRRNRCQMATETKIAV